MWNGGVLDISEGQFITGRKQIALDTGLKESTIEDILNFLEKQQQIRQQKTTKYRLITIINWNEYQHSDSVSDNKATTKQQQSDTNKNDKKVKNDKNNTPALRADDETSKFIFLFKEINPSIGVLYGRPPQRAASNRLLKMHPLEWWERFIEAYTQKLDDKFCPRASTPIQMEEKLGQIMMYAKNSKSKNSVKLI